MHPNGKKRFLYILRTRASSGIYCERGKNHHRQKSGGEGETWPLIRHFLFAGVSFTYSILRSSRAVPSRAVPSRPVPFQVRRGDFAAPYDRPPLQGRYRALRHLQVIISFSGTYVDLYCTQT